MRCFEQCSRYLLKQNREAAPLLSGAASLVSVLLLLMARSCFGWMAGLRGLSRFLGNYFKEYSKVFTTRIFLI